MLFIKSKRTSDCIPSFKKRVNKLGIGCYKEYGRDLTFKKYAKVMGEIEEPVEVGDHK